MKGLGFMSKCHHVIDMLRLHEKPFSSTLLENTEPKGAAVKVGLQDVRGCNSSSIGILIFPTTPWKMQHPAWLILRGHEDTSHALTAHHL